MKKVLITGAAGFLGRHLTAELLSRGIEVYAVVYPGSSGVYDTCRGQKGLHVLEIDLSSIAEHQDIVPDGLDVMYHFAWKGVRPELRNDLDLQMENIGLTMDCMQFAAEKGIRKVVFPGSTNEYLYYGKPLNKDAVPSPADGYGSVKVALRYLCGQFARQAHIEFVYTIIAGIYAADREDNNVIFYTIRKLLKGEKPSLTRLEQLWDYIYIDDVVGALCAIGETGRDGAVYAIGHGDNQPLADYIRIIHQKIDPALPLGIGEVPYASDRLPCSCTDLTDLIRDTGFQPKIDFESGISRVINEVRAKMERA